MIKRLFRLPENARRIQSEIDDEIAHHLETRVQELVARGMPADAARDEALRRFGSVPDARSRLSRIDRDRVGRERVREWLGSAWFDLLLAARSLRRQPGLAGSVVIALGLGIGATTAMFGIVDRLWFRPPDHVQHGDLLSRVYVNEVMPMLGEKTQPRTSYPFVTALRQRSRSFDGVGAFTGTGKMPLAIGAESTDMQIVWASSDFFTTLGVRPALGRFFARDEDQLPAGIPVIVLAYGFWRRQFAGEPAVLGRALRIGTITYTVVGVAPEGFTGVDLNPVDGWVPATVTPPGAYAKRLTDPGAVWVQIVLRRRPGVSLEQASAEATSIYTAVIEEAGADARRSLRPPRVLVTPLLEARGPLGSREAQTSLWLLAVSVMVLLLVCANVANLLLARAVTRTREIAVRRALGVSQARLLRLIFAESLVLTGAGLALALFIGSRGGAALKRMLLPDIAWDTFTSDSRVFALGAAAAIGIAIVTSLAPVLQASRAELTQSLRAGGHGATARRSRTRQALVIAQAALCTVLLVGSGLFIRSLERARALDLGLDPDRLIIASINGPTGRLDPKQADILYAAAIERVRQLPGVEEVALAGSIPFESLWAQSLRVPGIDSVRKPPGGGPYINGVSPEFFSALGTRIVRGRGLTAGDGGAASPIVINETMARGIWPGGDAIGKCVQLGGDSTPCLPIVGIARDTHRMQLDEDAAFQVYRPMDPKVFGGSTSAMFIRVRGEPRDAVAAVQREIRAAAGATVRVGVRLPGDIVRGQMRPWTLGATMFSIFGLLALIVASLGLFSVLAFEITQRRRELGVRIALGASPGSIRGLVLRAGMKLAAAGIVIGLALALVMSNRLASLLFQTSPRDVWVFGLTAAVLALVALAASLAPALRATRVDPATTLRTE